ncbi:nucleoside triphosphate pyrophosphatase [Acaryochloris sp. IP29b_bin.148]|uniref:Maf family protein n=1 Tax=Acaryochloris sp. IP29b_bin.148 TaxID=2969218 RepID=UPI002626D77D|nr:nucleoside triphosphate pyrophosphatase [Acaryochloris sp. IP29b_bin.148]
MTIPFILASASPARRQLLQTVGIDPIVQPSHFDESQITTTDPEALVTTLATGKAEVVAQQQPPPALVLGCDSVLELGGEIFGKPKGIEDAIACWQTLRGQTGRLLTGHTLIDRQQNRQLVRCQITEVDFAPLTDSQIRAYAETGEPLHCAGCFALDGRGGLFVDRIRGCHSNVVGLSLPLLRQMLAELGYDVTDLWFNE